MNKALQRALIIALVQVVIVSSLGAKLLYDRATRPRVWLRTQNYDPNLPIRGRYIALSPLLPDPKPEPRSTRKPRPGFPSGLIERYFDRGIITVVNGKPVVHLVEDSADGLPLRRIDDGDTTALTTAEPVLFFIPDTAQDPSRLAPGDQLWVEVTIPKKGPPRPIQLARSSKGQWIPLTTR